MGSLDGKIAIITGSGTGIGKSAAIQFAEQGASVVLVGRRQAPLDETAAEIEKAGGVVTRWDGGPAEQGGDVIAAATAQLHEAALDILNG